MPGVDGFAVALVAAATLLAYWAGKTLYQRFYLGKRLFFEPWTNLSGDEDLELGASLSELLYFELERLRSLLERAGRDDGLWHEQTTLPILERAFEGYPTFVRHVQQLGLPGRVGKLVQLVLLTRPQALRGTIHRFGDALRLQVVLEGIRDRGGRTMAPRCWAVDAAASAREGIPDAVARLAHLIVLDMQEPTAFRTAEGFMQFTRGLEEHLAFNETRQELHAERAQELYRRAIECEGQSAIGSYHLAEVHYALYEKKENEAAIREYFHALRTDSPALRARAFRGLANAYCQQRQRHKAGGDAALENALRYADFAYEICQGSDRATVAKALAYAFQVQAELSDLPDPERESYFQKAVRFYEEAIAVRENFTIAYNNLGYLYLQEALRHRPSIPADPAADQGDGGRGNGDGGGEGGGFERFLALAEERCRAAIDSDETYHHAWDNLGNILVLRARTDAAGPDSMRATLEAAERAFHKALSFHQGYGAAAHDLALLHLHRARLAREAGDGRGVHHHVDNAWFFHGRTLECFEGDPEVQHTRCALFADELAAAGTGAGGTDRARHPSCACAGTARGAADSRVASLHGQPTIRQEI